MKKEEKRDLVAREAAKLLYYDLAKEYKQAKENASKILGIKALPSNFEVAIEFDKIADEVEGASRKNLIVRLRREALKIMGDLEAFHPRLIGSVWRGTARKGSDIDIVVYCQDPELVLSAIKSKYNVLRVEYSSKTDEGETKRFFHIFINLPSGDEAEIVVRSLEQMNERYKCDIFNDLVTGLTIPQLLEVLKKDPLQKFIPNK